jgi:phosphatidylserine/phosphatidylglycerophosphate/cardiolipin synthase-like enzyme
MSARRNLVTESLADWLSLIEPTGSFLTLPVLKRAFPNGLERVEPEVRAEMRQRLEALGDARAERATWLRWVFADLLGYKDRLREGPAVPDALQYTVPEHGVILRPDFALVGPTTPSAPGGVPRLLVEVYALGTDAEYVSFYAWPLDRRPMTENGRSAMHAKGVIVDESAAFVTSANLTGHALDENMELGLLVRGGSVPRRLAAHFRALAESGIIREAE